MTKFDRHYISVNFEVTVMMVLIKYVK